MIRTILASAATIALMGAAVAQEVPSGAGLTPGAPLAADPYTGEEIVAGESSASPAVENQAGPAVPVDRPVVTAPVATDPVLDETVVVERLAAPMVGVDVVDPNAAVPSPIGLTPGAPLGGDANDDKAVAGDASSYGVAFR